MLSFIRDKRGISEEFTSLPTLVVVMIGFGLFFALIGGVYYSYNEKVERIDKYETANFILEDVTAVDGPLAKKGVIRTGGTINPSAIDDNQAAVETALQQHCSYPGWEYKIEIEWAASAEQIIPFTNNQENTVAASKKVPVYLNEAQTVAGELRVIVWKS